VQADKIEKTGEIGFSGFKLLLKKGETTVGEFNGNSVEGWWIANKD
jgi:hypothetical protein